MPQRKLLLADDSITIQKVVNLTFADEGFDVITANNGDEALRQISEQRPDIVLADVNIPGPNGYEICEMVRHIDEIKDLPVVLLVGSYEPFDPDRAQHVGANDFLTKPFSSIRQLVATVSNLMPEQPVAMPSEELPEAEEAASPDAVTLPMAEGHHQHESAEPIEAAPTAEFELAPDDQAVEPTAETAEYSPAFTDDIENLYDQSLAATIEIPHATVSHEQTTELGQEESAGESESAYQPPNEELQSPSYDLGDPSMDDEMIETVYAAEPETPSETEGEQSEPTPETEQYTQLEAEQPLTFETESPAEERVDSNLEPPAELSEGEEQDFLRNLAEQQPASYLSNEPENETFFEAEPESEPEPEPEFAGDEAMAFRAEEPVPSERNGNGAHSHEVEEQSSEEPQLAESAAQPEPPTPWDSVAHPRPFNPPPADTVTTEEFEESDLLGLVETAEPSPPTTWQEASIQDVGAPQFSDEVIDRIADRVVAKLSEQLVREIADRIVPDAVESFILKKFGRSDDR